MPFWAVMKGEENMDVLLFSRNHIWVMPQEDQGIVCIGLTDYAQEKLGAIMFLNLPDAGTKLERGEVFGDVESIKTVTDLFSPIAGEVLEINESLLDAPEQINSTPYESWFVRLKLTDEGDSLQDVLMDREAYERYTGTL